MPRSKFKIPKQPSSPVPASADSISARMESTCRIFSKAKINDHEKSHSQPQSLQSVTSVVKLLNKTPKVFCAHELDEQITKMPLVGFCEVGAANNIAAAGINGAEGG